MKVYAVVRGEKHQGGEIERIFPSYKKALDYTLNDLILRNPSVSWFQEHPSYWTSSSYWTSFGDFIEIQAFDTSTGLQIPKPSE